MAAIPTKLLSVKDEIHFIDSNSQLDHILTQHPDELRGVTGFKAESDRQRGSRRQVNSCVSDNTPNKPRDQALTVEHAFNIGKESRSVGLSMMDKADVYRWADRLLLAMCFVVIGFVSATDTWLAYINGNILNVEKNPLCAWLLHLDADSCSYFIAGKTCGTLFVLVALISLLRARYRNARLIIAAVTLFQLGLFLHLCLSDPLIDGWINFQLLFDETEPSIYSGSFRVSIEQM